VLTWRTQELEMPNGRTALSHYNVKWGIPSLKHG